MANKNYAKTTNESLNFGILDSMDPKLRQAVLLMEASRVLTMSMNEECDGACDHATCEGDTTQDDIDDVLEDYVDPDEDVMADYDPAVNGADDENSTPDMEEIKDLVDDDKDAIDIMTNDDDYSAVVESSIYVDF